MRIPVLLAVASISSLAGAAPAADSTYAPLWLYQGTWHVTAKSRGSGAKPNELINVCALLGRYFACQQTVNGDVSALLIFIPVATNPGHYHTQNVTLDGRASGIGDLEISGDRWVYSNRWEQGGGKITYFRNTNIFTGKNHIHYEQAESSNGKDWTINDSGDETRVSAPHR